MWEGVGGDKKEEGCGGGWWTGGWKKKKERVVRLMPQGLGLSSNASWEKMVGKKVARPALVHARRHSNICFYQSPFFSVCLNPSLDANTLSLLILAFCSNCCRLFQEARGIDVKGEKCKHRLLSPLL